MEPFSLTHGSAIKTFSLEDNDATLVIASSDANHPHVPARVQYEQCENDAESTALVQKFVFDLQRQGWEISAD